MCENKCTGSCSSCDGCNEKFVLSTDKTVSFVSSFTFSVRNLNEFSELILVTECKKENDIGKCIVGIGYYADDILTTDSVPDKYEITNTELSQQNFKFTPLKNADRAEITIKCINGATLNVEHINLIKK